MIKKIIFFVEVTFSKRDYERFGIEIFMKNGLDVEIWDFTPFLYPEVHNTYTPPDPVKLDFYHVFHEYEEALTKISKLDRSSFIINFIPYNLNTFKIFRLISKMKVPYGYFAFAYPSYHIKASPRAMLKKIFIRLKNGDIKFLLDYLFRRIPFKFFGIAPARMIIASGEKYRTGSLPVSSSTEIVWAHTMDYDIYLREREDNNIRDNENRYAIFLDEYFPFHPEYTYIGVNSPVSADEYYPLLCRFFELIERTHGVNIVIAAHPRSAYEKHPDYFNGRRVIRGKTSLLVRKSEFVILHHSASLHYAILYKKPMIFVTFNKLQKDQFAGPLINFMAGMFSKKAINLDEVTSLDLGKELFVDEKAYDYYKNSYIKKNGTEELPFWQIAVNRLKKWEVNNAKR